MRIATAATMHGVKNVDEHHRWLLHHAKPRMPLLGVTEAQVGQPQAPNTEASPAVAYVNHGRWVADCPTQFCTGAMSLFRDVFLCATCLNAEAGYRYRLVEWPANRGEIEQLLSARLIPETANWRPGEPAELLAAENEAHR